MELTFRASLPPIQSAIKLDGQGGARIQLDVPEEDKGAVLVLSTMTERVFVVRINDEWEREAQDA